MTSKLIERLINKEYLTERERKEWLNTLLKHHTPMKLKIKIDKDGRTIWCCPKCNRILVKFWSDVETISPHDYCWECGQRLEWNIYDK